MIRVLTTEAMQCRKVVTRMATGVRSWQETGR